MMCFRKLITHFYMKNCKLSIKVTNQSHVFKIKISFTKHIYQFWLQFFIEKICMNKITIFYQTEFVCIIYSVMCYKNRKLKARRFFDNET
ncbi:hypothetical protein [Neodiprion sertifer nucleopolyhedrovirus]|uniref:Uncharacterized protein n=1 Tax=Neodiprion sertifer nucleopolyhedrovirus TaxID=111874 RepID=Q6JKD9_9CBAC|nr:hypothetical protein NeseNPV_gp21 [Neodiprion sertifer nucleopolyhedrovirus]AAQ96398.1 hypothetical protein [Neodiprion sertifer nucleopolyhedrovirus]